MDSLQVLLDEEQEGMDSAARLAEPRNTDSFDYSNYHTLNEASSHLHLHREAGGELVDSQGSRWSGRCFHGMLGFTGRCTKRASGLE